MIIDSTVFHINTTILIRHIIMWVLIHKPCLNTTATHTRIQVIVLVVVVIDIKPIKLICFANKVTLIHIIVQIILGNIVVAICWIEAIVLREIIHCILEIIRLLQLLLLLLLLLRC